MKLLFIFFLGIISCQVTAQSLAINTDGSTADASAILDVKSIAKGILIPRMTSVQRSGIATPANGLMVYDTDSLSFAYYNGSVWSFLKGASNNSLAWSLKGNVGTNATNNFIGTTDAVELKFRVNNFASGEINHSTENAFFGYQSGLGSSSSFYNTANGTGTLQNTNGEFNTAIGYNAMNTASSSFPLDNTAIGHRSMAYFTGGDRNVGVGSRTLSSNAGGTYNIGVGVYALDANINGNYNVAIGGEALIVHKRNDNNTAIGYQSLYSDTSGYSNTAIGTRALYLNPDRSNLVAIGDSALYNNGIGASNNFQGAQNTAIGSKALYVNTTGGGNTAVGFNVLKNSNGFNNTGIGAFALRNNSVGSYNAAFGGFALEKNTTGDNNVAMGIQSLNQNTLGSNNVALGAFSMFYHRNNDNNIAIGNYAMSLDTSGSNNIAIGRNALWQVEKNRDVIAIGTNTASYNGLQNLSYNIYIGDSIFTASNITNAVAIGSKAYVAASNSMILGSINGTNGAIADTKVGIGVTAPSEKLEIGNGRLRFKGNLIPSGFAHGITWTNNAGTTDRAFLGMETDNYFGIYQWGFGNWNIRFHNTTGEMGINKQPGTAPGESRLQIKQTNFSGAFNAIGIETAINTNRWDIWVDNNAGPDFNFNYNGTIRGYIQNATGNYIVSSDRRLKKDIQPAAPALANLLQMPVYTFRYISNSNADALSIGFMAQDVQKFYPNATPAKADEKGEQRLGLNYQAMTALTIKAIQEQQQIIEDQNKKIDNLQTQIDELKKLIKKD